MAKKCYFLQYVNCANGTGSAYLCSELIEYRSGGNCGGGYFYSPDLGFDQNNASEISGSVIQVSMSNCPNCGPVIALNQPCDCINGGCVPKTTYNTPGVFPTLAACLSGCAKNSNCTGECVDPAEIAAHQQAINNLKAKIC